MNDGDISPLRDLRGCVQACRACRYKSDSYASSWESKQDWNRKHLLPWESRLGAGKPSLMQIRYRDRVLLHVEEGEAGYRFGLLQDEAVLEIPDCPLHTERQNQSLQWLRSALPRGLPLRFVFSNRELLTLVLKSKPFEWNPGVWSRVLEELSSTHWRGIVFDFNASAGRRVFSAKNRIPFFGQDQAALTWKSRSFFYGPVTFLQNDFPLYEQAIDASDAWLGEGSACLDLYCGMGMSTSVFMRPGRRVLGIEVAGESVQYARQNVPDAQFLQGTIENRLPQIEAFVRNEPSVVAFVNPSRSGLGESVVHGLARLSRRPQRIAYLSCNPRTLAHDLLSFEANGYDVHSISPVDFFPRTGHIENLALITKNTD